MKITQPRVLSMLYVESQTLNSIRALGIHLRQQETKPQAHLALFWGREKQEVSVSIRHGKLGVVPGCNVK